MNLSHPIMLYFTIGLSHTGPLCFLSSSIKFIFICLAIIQSCLTVSSHFIVIVGSSLILLCLDEICLMRLDLNLVVLCLNSRNTSYDIMMPIIYQI